MGIASRLAGKHPSCDGTVGARGANLRKQTTGKTSQMPEERLRQGGEWGVSRLAG